MSIFSSWYRTYSIRKSRRILQSSYSWYKKKGSTLSEEKRGRLESILAGLDQAILQKNREVASQHAKELEEFGQAHFKKNILEYGLEFLFALLFALLVATVVRQVWFELYEIPTGSMRPTFEEKDHLTVSKLAFGINIPLKTEHFYFDPKLVQRTSVLIFSGEGIPAIDSDTTYFWVIPYKKRYIKRAIGKPGDSLYFYGGKIYGVDAAGNPIQELLNSPWMHHLEHIPFLNFEGKIVSGTNGQIVFRQMNRPVGRLNVSSSGVLTGEVFDGKDWVKDNPKAEKEPHHSIRTYSDFLGMRNFAMARLLTKSQVEQIHPKLSIDDLNKGVLYLELRHSPSLTYPKPRIVSGVYGYTVLLTPEVSLIPLSQTHLDAMMEHMYTARFVISEGRAKRYSNVEEGVRATGSVAWSGVPSGTYEFYFGKAVQIGWGGIPSPLPETHPLYSHTVENIQRLFNLGMEMDTAFIPTSGNQPYFPNRYAYFQDGDLYLLGAPVLKKEDPLLKAFLARELKQEELSSPQRPYVAFRDRGPPLKADGSFDLDFIRTFGVTVPENHYLVLGDNHAMSLDSRVFGFVPQSNLQGAPSLIIWPPGDRFGRPEQKPYPILNVPRAIVWSCVVVIFLIWYLLHRRNLCRPIFTPIKDWKKT